MEHIGMPRQRLAAYIDQVTARHAAWSSRLSSGAVKQSRPMIAAILALVLIAVAGNLWVRTHQLEIWRMSPHVTFFEGAPSFSTADAPYFLRLAEELMRSDSEISTLYDVLGKDGFLLPKIIAVSAPDSDLPSLLTTGNTMLLYSVSLTALMIVICFGATGYWLEGAVAGLGGGLSTAFLVRSSIGRIDTDQMNLGLIYLIFGLVILAGRAQSRLHALAWCVCAGVTARLFMSWYGKPELILMATFALFWLLCCLQKRVSTVIAGTLIFVLLANLSIINPFATSYLKETLVVNNFIFPNTLHTITEVRSVSIFQLLRNAVGSLEMGLFSLSGLLLFLFRHPIIAIALGPLVMFALLNFVIGNRAIFYSAPIMWFGAAFMMTTTAGFVTSKLSEARYTFRRHQIAMVAASSFAMTIAWVNSPTDYLPRPSFSKPVLEGLRSLKITADAPENSIVATWWDYGHASRFLNGLPVLHDGGSQTKSPTYFIARALLDSDQANSVGGLKFLSTVGPEGISAENNLAGIRQKFRKAISTPSPDLYLVVTSQMAGWMGAFTGRRNRPQ